MITPNADEPLQKLILYLKDGMNTESQLYTGKNAVEGTREFQTDLNTVTRFPLLMGYRTVYRGNDGQISNITIEWFVANPVEIEAQPGYLNWGARRLIRLLSEIDSAVSSPCMQIDPSQIRAEIRFGQAREGGLLVPFVRVLLSDVIDLE